MFFFGKGFLFDPPFILFPFLVISQRFARRANTTGAPFKVSASASWRSSLASFLQELSTCKTHLAQGSSHTSE